MLDSSSREREREEKEDERSGLERYIINFEVILSKLNHKFHSRFRLRIRFRIFALSFFLFSVHNVLLGSFHLYKSKL